MKTSFLVGALAAAGVGALLWYQLQANGALRAENESLRAQLDAAAQLSTENERLSNQVARAANPVNNDTEQELLRLRGEVGILRGQTNQLGKLQQENQRLAQALQARAVQPAPAPEPVDPAAAQLKLQGIAKMTDAKLLVLGLLMHARDHQGSVPPTLDQVAPYLANNSGGTLTGTNQFELVYQGSLNDIGNPAAAVVVRETQASQSPNGNWFRAYGFADGHSEIHSSVDGNFGPWEKEHTAVPKQAAQ
jgi:hypothetical protein